MTIAYQTFARLTEGVVPLMPKPDLVGDGHDPDRRRQARVPLGQRGQVRLGAGREWQTVLIRDLSTDGVGLQTEGPLAKGQPLIVRLTGPTGQSADLPAVVRWCEPGGYLNAAFHVGAEFVEPPPAQGMGPTRPTWLADLLLDLSVRHGAHPRR